MHLCTLHIALSESIDAGGPAIFVKISSIGSCDLIKVKKKIATLGGWTVKIIVEVSRPCQPDRKIVADNDSDTEESYRNVSQFKKRST